jgi:hypothetical protein
MLQQIHVPNALLDVWNVIQLLVHYVRKDIYYLMGHVHPVK